MLSFMERHVVACLLGAVAAVFLLYETSVRFFAYTGDAYVDSNVAFVAPEVSGPLAQVAVKDDARVEAGATIAEIERTPFALASAQVEVALAFPRKKMAQDAIAESQAMVQAAQASWDDAERERIRAEKLSQTGDISAAALDAARRDSLVAAAELRKVQSLLAVAEGLVAVRQAEHDTAARTLDKAQYDLSRTRITAPVAGRVAPHRARGGLCP